MTAPINNPRTPPYKAAGAVLVLLAVAILVVVYLQYAGDFKSKTQLTMDAGRAGLSMDKGAKVTFNGVEIGRVADITHQQSDGKPTARFTLDVDPKYVNLIPANVDAQIKATTVFGNKYVSFSTPKDPSKARISSVNTARQPIPVSGVTTEFNSLFETVVSISEKVDPIKLNQTLAATAQALDGLGDRIGKAIVDGNAILDDLNPKQAQVRYDIQRLAQLGDVYANAAPDLFDSLKNAVITARTLNEQRGNLDAALMASVGFGNTAAPVFEKGGPYLVRGAQDLIPTSQLLDEYSPEFYCVIRKHHDLDPKVAESLGGNGYSLKIHDEIIGGMNPYVYPDNLPRLNAHGGPEGKPGCWQNVTRDLWPAPYLVMDTGASIAPYNHLGLSSPFGCAGLPPCLIPLVLPGPPPLLALPAPIPLFFPGIEYIWGRQLGEYTINP
jgi:phospholipid/cholesterol/gamma-HCH transport system substrate-binding protein